MQLLSDPSLFLTGDYFSTRPLLWKIRREIDGGIEPVLIEKTHAENDLFLTDDSIEILPAREFAAKLWQGQIF